LPHQGLQGICLIPNTNTGHHIIKGGFKSYYQKSDAFFSSPFCIYGIVISDFIGIPKGKSETGYSNAVFISISTDGLCGEVTGKYKSHSRVK